jgi:hypothetical protein
VNDIKERGNYSMKNEKRKTFKSWGKERKREGKRGAIYY